MAALGMRRRPSGWGTSSEASPARTISSIAAPTGLACASETCGTPCPPLVTDTLAQALPVLDRKLHGFAAPDALMVGVETRSSSPVRLLRDKGFQSNLRGLYPCGEGAGYAGGIVSAAVDGLRVAEAVAHPPET